MKQGKYTSPPRRRRRRINWIAILFWILILLILVAGILLISRSCSTEDEETDDKKDGYSDVQKPDQSQGKNPLMPTQTEATTPETTVPLAEDTVPPTEQTIPPTEETEPPTEETEPSTEPADTTPPEYNATTGQKIVAAARSVVGKKYSYGGEGPDEFDTSGLVYYCLGLCDITVQHSVSGQYAEGEAVTRENLEPGDIVFFYLENPGEPEYVGIYIGDGEFIAASSSNEEVEVKKMTYAGNSYFAERFIGGRRYTNEP